MNLRIEKLSLALKENGLKQLIVCNPMSIEYLSGEHVEPGERLYALMVDDEGNTVLYVNRLFINCLKNITNCIFIKDEDDAVGILSEKICEKGIIGIDGNWPARFLLPLMEKKKSCRFINGSFIVDDLRRIKDEEEQSRMIRASQINDEVIEEIMAYIKPGRSEKELAEKVKELYLAKGCSGVSFSPIVSFGANAADPHHEADDTVGRPGDCVVIDIGGVWQGYCSDMTRTVFLDEISDEHRKIYEIVREANRRGIEAAVAGNRMCDVDNAAREYIVSEGYGDYFTHRTGHSIGREDHENGDVSSVNTAIIKVGQVFSVEPGIYIPQKNIGVRIEDLVLIGEDGHQVLNHVDRQLKILPFEKQD